MRQHVDVNRTDPTDPSPSYQPTPALVPYVSWNGPGMAYIMIVLGESLDIVHMRRPCAVRYCRAGQPSLVSFFSFDG